MFTGIIEHTGNISSINPNGENTIFTVSSANIPKFIGASIAINGACLTMINFTQTTFDVEAIPETLRLTNLSELKIGDKVNLELPLKPTQGLDGHFVTGHIDFTTKVISIINDGENSKKITFATKPEFNKFIAKKGSISINGVSLTISEASNENFEVSLIPYTLELTNLGDLKPNSTVNIEIDLIARYLNKLLQKND